MPSASSEIVINRPPDDVFEFLANPENDPQWRSGVIDLKRVSGNGIGARYAQGVKTIAFQTVTGPVRPRGRYRLTAVDDGTRVRFELEADVNGLKRLMAPMVQKTMNNEVGQLDRLKRVIEQR